MLPGIRWSWEPSEFCSVGLCSHYYYSIITGSLCTGSLRIRVLVVLMTRPTPHEYNTNEHGLFAPAFASMIVIVIVIDVVCVSVR